MGKGASVRPLTPKERENLRSRPMPVPEGAAAQPTPEPKAPTPDAVAPPDYAEQRRPQYERRYYGKGSGIQRGELQLTGGTDGGTQPRVKE